VAFAARLHGAKFGFDAEDDHVGELADSPENYVAIAIRRRVEKEFLPQCHHLTAAAPGIAEAYYHRYGVTMTPILNVFPRNSAPATDPRLRCKGQSRALSVYWFSQTIGPGRGLEQIITTMGCIRERLSLSIRGSDFLGYSAHLKQLAAQVGVGDSIHFLDSAPPDELVRLAAEHDVGLATELDTPPHRAICLPNKIFTYLLAGTPVLLSSTPAQRKLAGELGLAAQLIDVNNPREIARALETWADPKALLAAKDAAWRLGQTQFNWDTEKSRFLQCVAQALDSDVVRHQPVGQREVASRG
jgi:glycosyltransferase involved in cell wall biosynthesis